MSREVNRTRGCDDGRLEGGSDNAEIGSIGWERGVVYGQVMPPEAGVMDVYPPRVVVPGGVAVLEIEWCPFRHRRRRLIVSETACQWLCHQQPEHQNDHSEAVAHVPPLSQPLMNTPPSR